MLFSAHVVHIVDVVVVRVLEKRVGLLDKGINFRFEHIVCALGSAL